MAEEPVKRPDPPLHIGPLTTASRIRCAFTRLANAVLKGRIKPEQSNAAAYCIAGASKALELEIIERGVEQLRKRNELRERELQYFDAQVVNGTPGAPAIVEQEKAA